MTTASGRMTVKFKKVTKANSLVSRRALYGTVFCWAISAAATARSTSLHFAPNSNFSSSGAYVPGRAGFNLADVNSVEQLHALPNGVQGLVWIGKCGGVDRRFRETVGAYRGSRSAWGFYLMDDPDPRGTRFSSCAYDKLRAESDWIHENIKGAKTFIVLMNMGSSRRASFASSYTPTNSHVDLFGFSPYPCRTEVHGCDFTMIDRYVAAAKAAGIPVDKMIPLYQAFGEGDWLDDAGGKYILPTAAEEREIIARWAKLVPEAAFDYAYSWGSQRGDKALGGAADLEAIFSRHARVD